MGAIIYVILVRHLAHKDNVVDERDLQAGIAYGRRLRNYLRRAVAPLPTMSLCSPQKRCLHTRDAFLEGLGTPLLERNMVVPALGALLDGEHPFTKEQRERVIQVGKEKYEGSADKALIHEPEFRQKLIPWVNEGLLCLCNEVVELARVCEEEEKPRATLISFGHSGKSEPMIALLDRREIDDVPIMLENGGMALLTFRVDIGLQVCVLTKPPTYLGTLEPE